MGNRGKFAIVFVLVNLHLLRNISVVGYFAIYVAMIIWLLGHLMDVDRRSRITSLLPIVWVAIAVISAVVTVLISGIFPAAYGFARIVFALPILFALYLFTANEADLRGHVRTMLIFIALAAMTLPLQSVVGTVDWFVETGERGGYVRYGTLLGSLTSYGIVAGSYMVLAATLKSRLAAIVSGGLFFAAMVSLSKAAIANVVVALVFIAWMHRKQFGKLVSLGVVAGVLCAVILLVLPEAPGRVAAVLQSFGIETRYSTEENFDYAVSDSMIDRLTVLPGENIASLQNFQTSFVYLVGGGYGMGDTGLVPKAYSEAPMSHNGFVEILTVFGLLMGSLIIGISLWALVTLYRMARNGYSLGTVMFLAFGMLMVNTLFAGGTYYQPAAASLFFLGLFVASSHKDLAIAGESSSVGA